MNNDMTFNSIKAGRGMLILFPLDGPQNLLYFDVSNVLPVDTLTGILTSLALKSHAIIFDDQTNNNLLYISSAG